MKTLQGLKQMRRLNLRDTLITHDGLQSIEDPTNLEELDLYGAKITDSAVAHLRKLTALTKLKLERLDLQACARLNDDAVPQARSAAGLAGGGPVRHD